MHLARNMTSIATKMTPNLIDIGCNLLDPMFRGNYRGKQQHEDDFNDILQRGYETGISKIIITAGTLQESKDALDLARTDPRLYSTIGVHPTRCSQEFTSEENGTSYLEEMIQLAQIGKDEGNVVAIGEFGLDYDRTEFCPKDIQQLWFTRQLVAVAAKVDLPLFLHCRAAGMDMLQILKDNQINKGVVHSFDGSMEIMLEMCQLGLSIGINGCSLRTEENLNVVKHIPVDKLLIETDGPWCDIRSTHPGYKYIQTTFETVKKAKKWSKGKCVKNRQEPCHLIQVLEVVAGVRGVAVDVLAEQIYQNTLNVFPGLLNNNEGSLPKVRNDTEKISEHKIDQRKGKMEMEVKIEEEEEDKDVVQPFVVDDDFDYDNVKLSGRKQTSEGWKEYTTEDTYNGYLDAVGGSEEDLVSKKLVVGDGEEVKV